VRVFVTGATGFVGGHLVRALTARGDSVVALARRRTTHEALRQLGCAPVDGSLEDAMALSAALRGVNVVYHVAGVVGAPTDAEYFAVNEHGTRRLVEAVRAAAPPLSRFVYVSSAAALGPSQRGTPLLEDAPPHPLTPYGRSKLAGEVVVRESGLPWSIVRPPAVYGPGDRAFLRLFKIVKLGIAPVFGTSAQELSLVYVADLARAIVLAGTEPAGANQLFHAGHSEVATSGSVARAAGAAIGRKPVVFPLPGFIARPIVTAMGWGAALTGTKSIMNANKMDEFMAPGWLIDVTKAERLLGWKAAMPMTEGMRLTADWYRAQGWL